MTVDRTQGGTGHATLDALVEQLRASGVRLWVEHGQLRYAAPPKVMTETLLAELREHKAAMIELLASTALKPPTAPIIPRVSRSGALPLSPAQQRFWLLHQLDRGGGTYNVPKAVRILGALDALALGQAFDDVIQRHEALRTSFAFQGGEPVQIVHETAKTTLPLEEVPGNSDNERLHAARQRVAEEAKQPFVLSDAPLLRTRLLRITPSDHVLTIVLHHIAADGRSLEVLFEDLAAAYTARRRNNTPDFAPLEIQYADYAAFERARLNDSDFPARLDWWTATLDDAPPLLHLPTDHPRPPVPSFSGALEQFDIGEDLTSRIRTLAVRLGATPYMVVMAAFAVLMSRYSGQDDLSIGTPVENRSRPELEGLIGIFINTVVLRLRCNPTQDFATLVGLVRRTALDAVDHQDVPFQKLVETLQPDRGLSASPIFQVAVSWLNADRGFLKLDDAKVSPFDFDYRSVKFDLNLEIYEARSTMHVAWFYSTALFEPATIRRMIGHFLRIMESAIDEPEQAIGRISLSTSDERRMVVQEFNQIDASVPPFPTLVEAFKASVARQSDAVAICDGTQETTYADLDDRSSALAAHLTSRGVGAGCVAAVLLERSTDLMVSILAIAKTGAAYLPFDVQIPQERLNFMLSDAEVVAILTSPAVLGQRAIHANVPCIDPTSEITASAEADGPVPVENAAAYVIYTSGSTGVPKGVVIEHRSLISYLWWAWNTYGQDRPLDMPLFTSVAVDLTITSMFLPLISGGRVVVYRDDGPVPAVFQVFKEQQVDVVKLTPAHLSMLGSLDLAAGQIRGLILGGEDLKTDICQRVHDGSGGAVALYNEYGPTEATVGCMVHRFDPAHDSGGSVPIGRAAANMRVYVLEPSGATAPIGVTGELCVAGPGVARGYLARPELTTAAFVPDPFVPSERMYQTGDLARWRGDGILEYLGRRDDQVKIRGHRVELDEVAAVIAQAPGIQDCVVTTRGRKRRDESQDSRRCDRCGLVASYPGTSLNDEGICDVCLAFDAHASSVQAYFRTQSDLRDLFDRAQTRATGDYDCLALVSGGKDSVFMLAQLKEMGLRILAYTLDPGYLSEEAKTNVLRVTNMLGIDHVFGRTPHMNEIFVESLQQHANVCNGCFKTLYTLSLSVARERGIPVVITGLSRGQLFETRLSKYYNAPSFDADEVDDSILEARKIYHRLDDVVARRLDVNFLQDDTVFEQIEIVDFYRYVDVSLSEVFRYLDGIGWQRPSDTGRSTNCLINDVGIFVHTKKRGYHNYALPYSWDVRMGHKTREEAVNELQDDIDEARVHTILDEIGWTENLTVEPPEEQILVAYCVPDGESTPTALREWLATRLPTTMLPDAFVTLERLPLTRHGKVDRSALPAPDLGEADHAIRVMPRTEIERHVAQAWADALGYDTFSVHDDFFALGGHSLMATRVAARVAETLQVDLSLATLFEQPTIAEMASVLEHMVADRDRQLADILAKVEDLTDEEAESQLNT